MKNKFLAPLLISATVFSVSEAFARTAGGNTTTEDSEAAPHGTPQRTVAEMLADMRKRQASLAANEANATELAQKLNDTNNKLNKTVVDAQLAASALEVNTAQLDATRNEAAQKSNDLEVKKTSLNDSFTTIHATLDSLTTQLETDVAKKEKELKDAHTLGSANYDKVKKEYDDLVELESIVRDIKTKTSQAIDTLVKSIGK